MTRASHTPQGDELRGLLAALREDMLTAEQEDRLGLLLRQSDAALSTYIRTIAMQADLCGYLVGWAAAEPMAGPDGGSGAADGAPADRGAAFQDTLYGQDVFEAVLRPHADDEEEPLTLPPWLPSTAAAAGGRFGLNGRTWGVLGTLAAVLVIGLGLWFRQRSQDPNATPLALAPRVAATAPSVPAYDAPSTAPAVEAPIPPVVATVSASVGAAWQGADAPALGASLRAGRQVELIGGFARLTFANGVEVVVEAPARLVLASDARLALERGRLTAKVPELARGFAVATNRVEVVDLGTEFGVSVAADGSVNVPVFTGHVQARPAGVADSQPVSVEAGQTGRVDEAGVKVAPVGPEAADFVRDIHNIRAALPVRGTGEALKLGDPDPDWLIEAVSYDPGWKPRVAAVCGPGPNGITNDARSGWISTTGERPLVRGGRYTFTTSFDLKGFDPATARLHLRLGVDDFVREVRLNGNPTGITLARPGNEAKRRLHDYDIKEGFTPGTNRLEVVVENGYGSATKAENPMALRVELSGTAVRQVDAK